MHKKISTINGIKYGCIALFVFQCLAIIYVNLFRNGYHLGYDAAVFYLKAMEMSKYGTLTPPFFRGGFSSLALDSPVPYAAFLYSITRNIYVSFGLVNIVVTGFILYVFVSLLKDISNLDKPDGIGALSVWIPLNLLLSPFITLYNTDNPIDDIYSLLYVSSAFWGIRVLTGLLCIKAFLVLYKKQPLNGRRIVFIAAVVVMVFISGVSSGLYILLTFVMPQALFLFVKAMLGDNIKTKINYPAIYIVLLCAVVFLGKLAAKYLLGFTPPSDSATLIGVKDFFANFGGIFLGFLELMGGLTVNSSVPVVSLTGILFLINLSLCLSILCAFAYILTAVIKNKRVLLTDGLLLQLCLVVFNLIMFSLSRLTYNALYFEIRYLVPLLPSLFIIFGVFLASMDWRKYKTVRNTALSTLLVFLILSNICSQYVYADHVITNQHDLVKAISNYEGELVYVPNLVTARNLRVLDPQKVYKFIEYNDEGMAIVQYEFGNYTYYDNAGEYRGKIILLAAPENYDGFPETIKSNFVFRESVGYFNWNIYTADDNWLNLP